MFQNNITIKVKIVIGSAVVILIVACAFVANRFVMAADLAPIITSAGANPTTVTLTPGTYTFSGNLTIPSNIRLHFERGAVIQIDSGSTLSINGPIDDCLYQIFDDKNTDLAKGVKFANGNILDVRPEWWGASGSADADYVNWQAVNLNSNAFDWALNSHSDFHTNVIFSYGTYNVIRKMVLKGSISLIGSGKTAIRPSYWMNDNTVEDSTLLSDSQTSTISGIDFYNAAGKYNLFLSNGSKNWHISKCSFRWGGAWMIYINGVNNVKIEDSYIISRGKGAINVSNASDIDIEYNDIDNISAEEGVKFNNCTNCLFDGNIVFGGQSQAGDTSWFSDQSVLITGTNSLKITRNRFDMAKNGLVIDGSGVDVEDNLMVALSLNGIYSNGSFDSIIVKNNKIEGPGKYDPNYSVLALNYGVNIGSISNSSIIKDNLIELWKLGAINFTANPTSGSYPLIEDNQGIDVTVLNFPILASSATPQATISSNWQTNNASPVTLTDFTKAPTGKEIFILFKDNNTTIKFTGSSKLQGNGGLDWKPTNGDHMRCTKQSTGYWNCIVGNDTGLAVSVETDTTPPTIANAQAIDISTNQATITWQTNENSTSQVEYGLTASYGSQTTIDSNLTSSHSVNLTNLTANTTYHFRVKSKDSSNNEAVSPDYTFTTLSANKPEDINQDGSVNTQDIQACVNQILNLQSWPRADVNQDGKFDVKDLQRIVNVILGV